MNYRTYLSTIGFILILITAEGFCDMIILRHPPSEDGKSRHLTCVTENDGSAVVWNYDYTANVSYGGNHRDIGYQSGREKNDWKIDYSFYSEKRKTVESVDEPIGPVFDHRWEAFEEYPRNDKTQSEIYELVKMIGVDHVKAVFSARGIQDINILLCKISDPMQSFCFSIVIGSSRGKESKIQTCEPGQLGSKNSCKDLDKASHDSPIIDLYEWRTFRIESTNEKREIKLFKGSENAPFLSGSVDSWNGAVNVYVKRETSSRVRFHFYQYHRTNMESTFYSNFFIPESEDLSVQVPVALCSDCVLEISLQYHTKKSLVKRTIYRDENSAWNDYPPWQLIDFNTTLPDLRSIRLKFESKFASGHKSSQGLWAVGAYRIRDSFDEPRTLTITINRENERGIWPKVTCQKLSYGGNSLVDSLSKNRIDDRGIKLQRLINAWEKSYGSSDTFFGKGGSICNQMGCQCARGFRGSDCSEKCPAGRENSDCVPVCEDESFLPPLCEKEFERPVVRRLPDSSVEIFQNVDLEPKAQIRFDIFQGGAHRPCLSEKAEEIEPSSKYRAHIAKLRPGTEYTLHTVISVPTAKGYSEFESPIIEFRTNAFSDRGTTGNSCVTVVPKERSIILNIKGLKECQQLLDMPLLGITQSNGTSHREAISGHHYEIKDLTSYTEYKLAIWSNGNRELWGEKVRTLESAPGEISRLQSTSLTDTGVTFEWVAPSEKNGIIRKYTVTIQLTTLLGCQDLGKPTPKREEMTIEVKKEKAVFKHLHPYAQYKIDVTAHTFKSGSKCTSSFQTKESEIPTSVVSDLRFNNNSNRIEWDKPENCTTISGPSNFTKLVFKGISPWAQSWTEERTESKSYFPLFNLPLTPYTFYQVRAYVVRQIDERENSDLYKEMNWRTPAGAPPAVLELKIFDADSEKNIISLRWKPPYPPYGEIESYKVSKIDGNSEILESWTIQASEGSCDLWEDYVCSENIPLSSSSGSGLQVKAKNKNVEQHGAANRIRFVSQDHYEKAPGNPRNLTVIDQGHGIVMVKWRPPLFSATKIKKFQIFIKNLDTDLANRSFTKDVTKDYDVTQKQKEYNISLLLLPSTKYKFTINAVNARKKKSQGVIEEQHKTSASIGFASEDKLEVKFSRNTLNLIIPRVENTTCYTTLTVIVRGPFICKVKQSDGSMMESNVEEWEFKTYEAKDIPESLIIDEKQYRNDSLTCSLDPEKEYHILLHVKDPQNNVSIVFSTEPPKTGIPNLAWLIILLIIVIAIPIIFFLWRRWKTTRLEKGQKNIIQLESTSFSTGDSTAPCTLNRKVLTPRPDSTLNRSSISQTSPDVVPIDDPNSCPVKVEEFEEYTKEALASGLLELQYEAFPKSSEKSFEHATMQENLSKNRYKDRIPYDETRVVLEKISGDLHSDYINASYIQGYRRKKAYIATQGPKQKTVRDFWRMIWQENVHVICMLANIIEGGKTKCEKYWPDVGTKVNYGNIIISNTKQMVFADFTFRTFTISSQKKTREVNHLHFTGWPDHGVPMYTQSLVTYLKKLLATSSGAGPVLVHCSAGVGRTGTIILCDICLRQAVAERIINVPAVIARMRDDRPNMVDNVQQYMLAHLAIVESMIVDQTQIRCDNYFTNKIIELRNQLPSDVKRLKEIVWQDRALHSLETPRLVSQDDENSRIRSGYPSTNADRKSSSTIGNSIEAVNVDGARMKNQFLACRLPQRTNLSDMWLLIRDKNVELVIILQKPRAKDLTSCDIVPNKDILNPVDDLKIERKTCSEKNQYYTIDKLLLTDSSKGRKIEQPVTVLTFNEWVDNKKRKLPAPSALVSLWMASEKIARKEGQTLVLCQDGVTGSGLYLALSFLLERIAVEGECDVISSVRAIRRSKIEFVKSLDQFVFLYDAAENYVKYFEIYANFS